MSAYGRKYQHPELSRQHAPVTDRGLKGATKLLIIVLVLAVIGGGWGYLNAGALLAASAGIGEALP